MDDVVVGALCEGAIDVAERLQTFLCHTCRECHRMTFSDAYIERALGHLFHHDVHRTTCRHSGSDTHDARVLFGQPEQSVSEDVLVSRWLVLVVAHDALSRLRVEFSWCMPHSGTFLGGLISFSLLGVQMQQFWAFHVLQLLQHAHQLHHVVPVVRAYITDVHALEDVLLVGECRLQRVVQSDDSLAPVVVHHTALLEPLRRLETQSVVGLVGIKAEQIFFHSSHSVVDGHVVVVEHDKQVIGCRRRIVESLECQAATHGSIADDGHHLRRVV